MHKKTDILDLDIPKDDIECWERYPKHHWVYDLSRLLDAQNIKWSPYEVTSLPDRELNMRLETDQTCIRQPGYIFVKRPDLPVTITEVYITKGEIKLMRHLDALTKKELQGLIGEIELRISAFVTIYFQKFTGVISVESLGPDIYSMRLKPYSELSQETNAEVIKLIKRIFKKTETVIGLKDRALHESLAS